MRRLYQPPAQHLTLGQVVELNRRLLEGYELVKDEPRVQKLRTDVLAYNRLLRDLGLRDHQVVSPRFSYESDHSTVHFQVARATKATWKILGLLTYRIGLLAVWTLFALPGTILNGPIFISASIISRKKAKGDHPIDCYVVEPLLTLFSEALAASSVKVAGRDVLASWKVLISLVAAPILYAFYALLAVLVAIKSNAPLNWIIGTPFLVIIAVPFMNYTALKFGEAGVDVLKCVVPFCLSCFGH